jgi:hypothetical protein
VKDLAEAFRPAIEAHHHLKEIEEHIRALVSRAGFTARELYEARDPRDGERAVSGVSDLTLGECGRLIERKETWPRLGLKEHRKTFIEEFKIIRKIRNDIMHFRPGALDEGNIDALRKFLHFLRGLPLGPR